MAAGSSIMRPPVSGKRVILIGSLGFSLVNFRLDLMCRIVELGHEVIAVAPEFDAETVVTLSSNGIRTRTVQMERTGTRPAKDLRTLIELVRIFREEAPDIVVPYTMKPIVYGSLAARIAGVRECYPLFTGLGYLFAGEPAAQRRILRSISIVLHRIGLRKVTAAFCYNDAEERDIRHFGLIPSTVSLVKIPGTGIDTKRFLPTPMPRAAPSFLFVGRLLRSKGLDVLATAVRQLRSQGHDITVDLLGPEDSNPDAVDRATLEAWTKEGLFRHLGAVTDVRPVFAQSSIFVLPTTLREGVPRTILEAMACGLPVITTDAPGCGETITDGVSGRIVPQNDPAALGAAMLSFIEVPERVAVMGLAARAEVCRNNDVRRVNALLLKHMNLAAEVLPKPSVRAGIEAVA